MSTYIVGLPYQCIENWPLSTATKRCKTKEPQRTCTGDLTPELLLRGMLGGRTHKHESSIGIVFHVACQFASKREKKE